MALFSRSRLFGLYLLLALPLDGAAALALQAAAAPADLEGRLQRIEAAVRQQQPSQAAIQADDSLPADAVSYAFVNGPAAGWVNGGFRNGGFFNGGFRNGGFHNGGFRNGGFHNGGFRNGGGFRNAW
jgi:rSAM-associated Gly-rich repeat protein